MLKITISIFLLSAGVFSQGNVDYQSMIEQAMKMQQYGGEVDAILKRISGDVKVKSADSEDFIPVEDNSYYPVSADDIIKTGSNGYVELYFENIGVIKIDRNTEIHIESIRLEDTSILLKIGSIISKIEKFAKKKLSMSIKTPTAICAIRGTEFVVEHSAFNNETTFGVFDEGTISVTPFLDDKEGEPINVEKGNEVTISPSLKRYKIIKLAKMVKYRAAMIALRKNMASYKAKWKKLSPERKEYLRQILLKKKAAHVENKKNKIKKNKIKQSKYKKNNYVR